ncbi:MFS transporter [Vibrio fluvialis]|nr:MFS transporter [Vibrio fluvialis]MBY8105249.1 MFS transporter [Vibrio fluvialis]
MVTYVTSAVPIPLYGTYQLHDHVSYWQLSLSSVVYFIGAVTALVLLGRLSNHWGRKPVALISLMLAALSVAVFVNVHSAPPLIVGRLLQGLSCGLASTALASWLVDHARSVPSWIPAAVISCGPMTGLTLGGVGSGFLIEYAPYPRQLPFVTALVLIAGCLLLVAKSQETMPRKPGSLKSLRPTFTLPASAKKAFPLACAGISQGMVLTGSIGTMVNGLQPEERANVFAVIYSTSYAGAAIPTLISGQLSSHFSLLQIACGYGLLALFGSVVVLTSRLIKNPRQTSRETP